jgi:hypothetical protein
MGRCRGPPQCPDMPPAPQPPHEGSRVLFEFSTNGSVLQWHVREGWGRGVREAASSHTPSPTAKRLHPTRPLPPRRLRRGPGAYCPSLGRAQCKCSARPAVPARALGAIPARAHRAPGSPPPAHRQAARRGRRAPRRPRARGASARTARAAAARGGAGQRTLKADRSITVDTTHYRIVCITPGTPPQPGRARWSGRMVTLPLCRAGRGAVAGGARHLIWARSPRHAPARSRLRGAAVSEQRGTRRGRGARAAATGTRHLSW